MDLEEILRIGFATTVAAGAVGFFGSTGFLLYYVLSGRPLLEENYSLIGFKRDKNAAVTLSRWQVVENKLTVTMGEPFQVDWTVWDTDGLACVTLAEDGNEIVRAHGEGHKGYVGTLAGQKVKPGKHRYQIVSTNANGRVRKGNATLTVLGQVYNGEPETVRLDVRLGLSVFYDNPTPLQL